MTALDLTVALTASVFEAACAARGLAPARASAARHIAPATCARIPRWRISCDKVHPPMPPWLAPLSKFRLVSMAESYRSAGARKIRTFTCVVLPTAPGPGLRTPATAGPKIATQEINAD